MNGSRQVLAGALLAQSGSGLSVSRPDRQRDDTYRDRFGTVWLITIFWVPNTGLETRWRPPPDLCGRLRLAFNRHNARRNLRSSFICSSSSNTETTFLKH